MKSIVKFIEAKSNRSFAIESNESRFPRNLHLGKIEANGKEINGFDIETTLTHIDPSATLHVVDISTLTKFFGEEAFEYGYDMEKVEKEVIKYWVSLFDSKDFYERELSPVYIARYAEDLNVTSEALIEWANN